MVWQLVIGTFAGFESIRHSGHIEVREGKASDVVLVLHEGVEIGEAGDFRLHDEWLDLTIKLEVSARPRAIKVRLAQTLDLDFTDELADPLPGLRLLRCQPNGGGRLG